VENDYFLVLRVSNCAAASFERTSPGTCRQTSLNRGGSGGGGGGGGVSGGGGGGGT